MHVGRNSEVRYGVYYREFRICIANTVRDMQSVRAPLNAVVFPELRALARRSAVLLRESDPRWEASLAPQRIAEIRKTALDDLYGYRPALICILERGGGSVGTGARFPWLSDMSSNAEIAYDLIARALSIGLMRGRVYLYVLERPDTNIQESDTERAINRLLEHARASRCEVREGILDTNHLARLVFDDLRAAFERQFAGSGPVLPAERDRDDQARFADSHRHEYVEIGSYIDRLDDAVVNQGYSVAVMGESGTGKSALLIAWLDHLRISHPDIVVFHRFIDPGAGDIDVTSLLRYLVADLREYCGVKEIPDSSASPAEQVMLWLAHAPVSRTVIVVLDGIDRLAAIHSELGRLPRHIPDHIRFVVSGEAVDVPAVPRWWTLQMQPLTLAQCRTITDRLVAESGSLLDPDFFRRISDTWIRPSPFFLRTIIRHAQAAGKTLQNDGLNEAATIEDLMVRILEQAELRYGTSLVSRTLGLLCCARRGLARAELAALVGGEHAPLMKMLEEFAQFFGERDGYLRCADNPMRRALERRYVPTQQVAQCIHAELAAYFASMPVDERRVNEEPWHWRHAGDRDRLAECITAISMFLPLSTPERTYELLEYCIAVADPDTLIERLGRHLAEWLAEGAGPSAHVRVLERIGRFCMVAGWLAHAEQYLRSALQANTALYGDVHMNVADTLHDLAELLRRLGRYAEAEVHYRRVLSIRERELGTENPGVAGALSDLALLYRFREQYQAALPLYSRAVALKEKGYGPGHPETAETLNDLALVYIDLRDLDGAAAVNTRVLSIRQTWYGNDHPVVATSHSNLGSVYRLMRNLEAAEVEYRRALAINERRLGPEHPETIVTLVNLASLLQLRGVPEEALALFARAHDAAAATLAPDHPTTTGLTINYAQALRQLDKFDEAERILRDTLERLLGSKDDQPYLATCANNLASLLLWRRRPAEALPLVTIALERWELSLGSMHPNVALALDSMAAILLELGCPADAEPPARRAFNIRAAYYGPGHELTLRTAKLLASIESHLKQ
ncbi:MAG: tetratricopeptide repeat protein [Bacteroidetes bacterium]|nr:tetratricopeptide repeat protein [Bacteroidota bacterium]